MLTFLYIAVTLLERVVIYHQFRRESREAAEHLLEILELYLENDIILPLYSTIL